MSNPDLAQETLDYIVDFLQGKPEALKACCLVSKSWVTRTRKHLFASILLRSADDLKMWKAAFPDPSNSPAHYTQALLVCSQAVPGADVEAGDLIRTFSRITRLDMAVELDLGTSLAPFRGISPILKSLRVYTFILFPQVFDLIPSFPLLEDLALTGSNYSLGNGDDQQGPETIAPSTSPPLTGCLDLLVKGMEYPTRRLMDLPNGIHFRKLILLWLEEDDFRWIMELVMRCSDTLECLDIRCTPHGTFVPVLRRNYNLPLFVAEVSPAPIDLSKAMTLRDVVFRPGSLKIAWITLALQTITPKHRDIRRVSISVPGALTPANAAASVELNVGDEISSQWLDLDRLFVKLWEPHKIRPKVVYTVQEEKDKHARRRLECLLPEMTKRGIIDLVEQSEPHQIL